MKNIKKELESKFKHNQIRIEEMKAKLNENYCHYFAWVGEDLFRLQFTNDHLECIISDLESIDEIEVVTEWTKRLQGHINPHEVRENSTGSLFREASTYKFIVYLELLQLLKKF
jgi:hypothetical protein